MGNCATGKPGCGNALNCMDASQRQGLDAPCWEGAVERPASWPADLRGPQGMLSEFSGLTMVAECCQPLLFEIVAYLAGTPKDFAHLCRMSARFVAVEARPVANSAWRGMYAQRWRAFYDCLEFQGFQDWCHLYRQTLSGHLECTLEVFDREKKLGFAMAAMPARVQYEPRFDAFMTRYLSASEVPPEKIPIHEEHRLRFCPESARAKLLSGHPRASENADQKLDRSEAHTKRKHSNVQFYPYRVLEGIDGLEVGAAVELQWKMQEGSPFGWWYGQLDALTPTGNGLAQATITFRHFPATSRWYKLDVLFGDARMRDCDFGGFTGGIRAVSEVEKAQAMRFFPKEPVIF